LFVFASALYLPIFLHAQHLPGGIHPEHYSLALTPDLKAATFSGSEMLDVTLDAPFCRDHIERGGVEDTECEDGRR